MRNILTVAGLAAVTALFAISACSTQEEVTRKPPAAAPKTAPAPAPAAKAEASPAKDKAEKAKVVKAKGDVGLVDTEKNYMILVTKDGKLVTLDFDSKTKVTKIVPTPGKISDVGLGSTASVQYTKEGEKNVATKLDYTPAKGE
jgi:hypothetical protein